MGIAKRVVAAIDPALASAPRAENKSLAMELGQAAGELYARRLFESKGIDAMREQLARETFEQDALNAFYEPEDDVHPEFAAKPTRVHPYHVRAYCEMFAVGARRFAEMLAVDGYKAAFAEPVDPGDVARRNAGLKRGRLFQAMREMAREDVSDDHIINEIVNGAKKTRLGNRPALAWAYDAGLKVGLKDKELVNG